MVAVGIGVGMSTEGNVTLGLRVVPGSNGAKVSVEMVAVGTGVAMPTEGNVTLGLRVVPSSNGA